MHPFFLLPSDFETWRVTQEVEAVQFAVGVRIAEQDAPLLVRELESCRVKVPTSVADDFETWREGPQDDLVLAVAIAAWQGENQWEFWYLA